MLWRGGLRIAEALALGERDLDPKRGSLLVRNETSRLPALDRGALAIELDDDQQSDAGARRLATSDCGSWRGIARAIACA